MEIHLVIFEACLRSRKSPIESTQTNLWEGHCSKAIHSISDSLTICIASLFTYHGSVGGG